MSKDQLSWEQLLKNTLEETLENAAPSEEKSVIAPDASADNRAEIPKEKTKAKPRSKKAKASAEVTEKPEATSYAKKDWSKLEFASTAAANTVKIPVYEKPLPTAPAWLGEEPEPPVGEVREPSVLSVSELNRSIRGLLEGEFPLIWVKGEISNFKAHTSGHFYFSLKDAKAQISAVMFRGLNSGLRFRPEDGMEVLVRGKITVYEPRGNYQIFCEMMEPVGAGALQKAFEQLKAKLQKEGLFDPARKRPLPSLPKHIAIVTSPTGAAIRDMLNVLGRRYRGAQITVVPCKVQGDQAPGEIVAAIGLACRMPDVDVMIVGRGGGSIEDLWAFNDERVARAIAASRVPVISAVGHEVDFTIADFVADLRAPTPSAAAELVVKNAADLIERVSGLARALKLACFRSLTSWRQEVSTITKGLVDPQRRIQDASLRCDELLQRLQAGALRSLQDRRMTVALLTERMGTPLALIAQVRELRSGLSLRMRAGMRNLLLRRKDALAKNMAVLDSLSPLKVLDRGYSMVVVGKEIVTDAASLKVGQSMTVRMCKGSVEAQVLKVDQKR